MENTNNSAEDMAMNIEAGIRNICIYGVGGVGGFFGGKIAYEINKRGDDSRRVFFIARGPHLAEIRKNGLILNTPEQRGMICMPTMATDNVGEIPPPDLCLVCVKSYDLDNAVKALAKNINTSTIIIPLLNGVDVYERIRTSLEDGIVLPACVYVGTHIDKAGVVTQSGGEGIILCGSDPGITDFNPEALIRFFSQENVKFRWNDDPYPEIWKKYIFIASFGLVSAYSGKTLGEIVSDQRLKETTREIMREIVAMGGERGIELPEDVVNLSIEKARDFPPETKTSYQTDVDKKGKRNEGDLFGGTIIRLGHRLGVPTPVTEGIYSEIQKRLEQSG
jgi:2-dehydropantoate 2-reductase